MHGSYFQSNDYATFFIFISKQTISMKKIILSIGMLIAIATASYAQTNTSTVNQANGDRNQATVEQMGQLQKATIIQTGATTTDNKATINQKGTNNAATINEKGKGNDVTINQDNLSSPSTNHTADVTITNAVSDRNSVIVTQTGKKAVAVIDIDGDDNEITFDQAGDENQARYIGDAGGATNDDNIISFKQTGRKNQAFALTQGDDNNVNIDQSGNDNRIGRNAGAGAQNPVSVTFNRTRMANSLSPATNPNSPGDIGGIAPGGSAPATVSALAGINVLGDRNVVQVTQGANTRNNEVAVEIGRDRDADADADDNRVVISQLGTSRDNLAVVKVVPGSDLNTGTISQTGTARGNTAGIYFEGDNDNATISQSGDFNQAITYQRASTVQGSNSATINQSGNFNTGFIQQDGIRGSSATLTQLSNFNYAEIYQTDNGGHSATVSQNSLTGGSRLILEQRGSNNSANLVQVDRSGAPTDVEIQQTGIGNSVSGINAAGVQRVVQMGNGNVASY